MSEVNTQSYDTPNSLDNSGHSLLTQKRRSSSNAVLSPAQNSTASTFLSDLSSESFCDHNTSVSFAPAQPSCDPDTLAHFLAQQAKLPIKNPLLTAHEISPDLRARMVDWMIEVTSKANCSRNTLFYAANIMDRFLCETAIPMKADGLHLLGVVCMMVASKLEDVAVMDQEFMCEYVIHGKATKGEMAALEREVLKTLGFWVSAPHERLFVTEIINVLWSEEKPGNEAGSFSQLREDAQTVATLNLFNEEFSAVPPAVMAAGSIMYSAQRKSLEHILDVEELARLANATAAQVRQTEELIAEHTYNFRDLHPGVRRVFEYIKSDILD